MRGPGESQIETDKRIILQKITLLKEKLEIIDKQNETQRKNRNELIRVALVGYTNVGKSTIMNMLSKSEVFAENKLFATLDTTTRKVVFEATPFLLSDTVGFIRKLPHHLVESFKSTLDEVREADVLLHVVDISHAQYEDQIGVVNKTLQELKAFEKPIVTIFNKMDLYRQKYFDEWISDEVKQDIERDLKEKWIGLTNNNCVFVSAIEKQNIEELRTIILHKVRDMYQIKYPYKTVFF
jgi:GTP-binding protein HflX